MNEITKLECTKRQIETYAVHDTLYNEDTLRNRTAAKQNFKRAPCGAFRWGGGYRSSVPGIYPIEKYPLTNLLGRVNQIIGARM